MINAVYYAHTEKGERFVNPVAIRPRIRTRQLDGRKTQILEYSDLDRGTLLYLKHILNGDSASLSTSTPPRQFKVVDEEDNTIVFDFLTKKLWEDEVEDQVFGKKTFESDEELQAHFLKLAPQE